MTVMDIRGCLIVHSKQLERALSTIGLSGQPLISKDLPTSHHVRWVVGRKAELIAAIRGGLITMEDACERYRLSAEELATWSNSLERHGLCGLRCTKLHLYRRTQ